MADEHVGRGLATRAVYAGDKLDAQGGTHLPLDNRSTLGFRSTQDVLGVGADPDRALA